jgi:hypothetical protein
MKEQWRQQMQQKMADYQQPAPEVSWDQLDKALAANKSKAKVMPMWTRWLAAAVMVGAIAIPTTYLAFRQQQEVSVVSQNTTTEREQTHDEVIRVKDEAVQIIEEFITTNKKMVSASEKPTTTSVLAPSNSPSAATTTAEVVKEKEIVSEHKDTTTTTPHSTIIYPSDFQHIKRTSSPTTAESRLMAKAYLSNSITGGANAMSMSTVVSYNNENTQNLPDTNNPKENNPGETLNPPIPVVKEKEKRVTHRQPIRFGLALCYCLNDKWSIESGLVYTRLLSDYSYLLAGEPYAQGEQQLNYLGIPLKVNHQLWSTHHMGVYLSAGGIVEKMVKGTLQTTENGKDQKTDVSIRSLQYSVNGAIGIAYHLTPMMSIYAEPGVGYYFDNGSSIPTYYQEKPFSFNLNVGLRFSIK